MFWWRADWSLSAEPSPAITVSAVRLDGGGMGRRPRRHTAIADFGTATLVGVEFPFPGDWQMTATYRGASLTHVLWIKP